MSERAAYSRVYWSIVDDPKFADIYDDDRHLACWLRLLLIADQAHPASANIPAGTRRASILALTEAGLVSIGTGSRFRITGLDAERERRRVAATNRGPKGNRTVPERDPDGIQTPGLRRDERETRRDETSARADFDALDVYHELTGYRPWGQWSGDAIKGAVTDYGDATVQAAIRTEYDLNADRNDLLKRVQARLARDADKAKQARTEKVRPLRPVVSDKDRVAAIREIQAQAKEGA